MDLDVGQLPIQIRRTDAVTSEAPGIPSVRRGSRDGPTCLAEAVDDEQRPRRRSYSLGGAEHLFSLFKSEDIGRAPLVRCNRGRWWVRPCRSQVLPDSLGVAVHVHASTLLPMQLRTVDRAGCQYSARGSSVQRFVTVWGEHGESVVHLLAGHGFAEPGQYASAIVSASRSFDDVVTHGRLRIRRGNGIGGLIIATDSLLHAQ